MTYDKFIQPKEIEIGGRKFTVSKIPAMDALTIYGSVAKSITENGLLGITMLPQSVEKSILGYTALSDNGINIIPNTDVLINDIFKGDVGDLKKLVVHMVKENFSFLIGGDLLNLLADKVEATDSVS